MTICIKASSERLVAKVIEAVTTSETSVSIYQTTRRNIPEDSHLDITLINSSDILHADGFLISHLSN
jgi:hypothetical protein